MYKYLNNVKPYADCSGRVMETGDHFKNGASPKSLTSRGNRIEVRITESARFKSHFVEIGTKTAYNVTCSIANSIEAPMLLGQSVLSQFGKYTFDYRTERLIIK
jgi:hypothetical protein